MGKPMDIVYIPDENGNFVPTRVPTWIGFVGWYAGPEPPEGYLYCDGSAIGRETYKELFEAVGTLYGAGDGAETFNLPDARGIFFRGDGGENSAAMGVIQGDAIREITGRLGGYNSWLYDHTTTGCFQPGNYSEPKRVNKYEENPTYANSANAQFKASYAVPTANENRPVNLAMKPCIRYV